MHFFNSLQEDFANIGSDLTEFVETVKKDTSKALGITLSRGGGGGGAEETGKNEGDNTWLDDLFDNPELLIEEKVTVTELDAKACETMLRGEGEDSGVPELYVELVPTAMTHEDFFLRLLSYRVRKTSQSAKGGKSASGNNHNNLLLEEEVGWDEDNIEAEPATKKKPAANAASSEKTISELRNRVSELERLLEMSRAEKKELEKRLEKLEARTKVETPISPTSNNNSVVLVDESATSSTNNANQLLTKNENSWDVLNNENVDGKEEDEWD